MTHADTLDGVGALQSMCVHMITEEDGQGQK